MLTFFPRDHDNKFFALKILTLEATEEHAKGRMLERKIMQTLRRHGEMEHLPYLVDTFDIDVGRGKQHICFVLNLLGSDVASLRRSALQKALPVHVVRVIIRHVLTALSYLHKLGIVHTGAYLTVY